MFRGHWRDQLKVIATRYWALIIAISLGLVISACLWIRLQPEKPELPRYQPGYPYPSNYHPGGSACDPKALASITLRRKRIAKSDDCSEKAQQYSLQSNDLIQQTRAADAARAEAILAYDGAWVDLWATLAGLWTLIAAAIAAFYARQAAVHTENSVILSQRSFDLDRPACLTVDQVTVELVAGKLSGECLIMNEGKAKASIKGMEGQYSFYLGTSFPQTHPSSKTSYDPPIDSVGAVAQFDVGTTLWWTIKPKNVVLFDFTEKEITQDDVNAIKSGENKIFFLGRIAYLDTVEHQTMFCFVYSPTEKRWVLDGEAYNKCT